MKCRRHGILGVPRHVRPEPSFAFLSGPTVRGDRFAQARRYGDDSHRAEQMLMQLAQFPGDDVVPARQFRAQPQRPVPEMIVNAGQRGRIHLPRRCGLVRAAEQQVHLCRAGHDQHVAPGAAEPVPLRDDRVQGPDHAGKRDADVFECGHGDRKVPVGPGCGLAPGARPGQFDLGDPGVGRQHRDHTIGQHHRPR